MLQLLTRVAVRLGYTGSTPTYARSGLSLSVSPQSKTGRQMSGTRRSLWRFEAFLGPIGMRAEAGDSAYFDRGVKHNLRIALGPTIRF